MQFVLNTLACLVYLLEIVKILGREVVKDLSREILYAVSCEIAEHSRILETYGYYDVFFDKGTERDSEIAVIISLFFDNGNIDKDHRITVLRFHTRSLLVVERRFENVCLYARQSCYVLYLFVAGVYEIDPAILGRKPFGRKNLLL